MKNFPPRAGVRAVGLGLLCLGLSGCPFANQLGYRPQGGIKGSEVQDMVKFETLAAYTLAMALFCNELFDDEDCRNSTASQASQGGLAASLIAAELTPVESGKNYTADSVESCLDRMVVAVDVLVLAHLNSKKSCSTLIATNCTIAGGEVIQAGIVAGMTAPAFCNVEAVGRILSFHQYNL